MWVLPNPTITLRILTWVQDDLHWWNELLLTFYEVMFFVTNRSVKHVYIDACLVDLEEYVSSSDKAQISQNLAFRARVTHSQEKLALSINVREMKAILLTFQFHFNIWHRLRIVLFTDSITVFSSLTTSTLKNLANASLRVVLLLIVKWDIIVESRWISTRDNILTDALFRFDDEKLANMCSDWQNYNSMNCSSSIYSSHRVQF
jgi:hypothetical protein